ncbi:hypothetical protein EMIT053CA3_20334 [Pseudomonas donghuensis]
MLPARCSRGACFSKHLALNRSAKDGSNIPATLAKYRQRLDRMLLSYTASGEIRMKSLGRYA